MSPRGEVAAGLPAEIGKPWDVRLLSGAAMLVPSLGILAPLGMAPLLALVAAALLILAPRRSLILAPPLVPLAILLALLAAWAGLSASWSLIPGHSLFEAGRFLLIGAAGLTVAAAAIGLDDPGRAAVGRAALVGWAVGTLVLLIELLGNFPIRHLVTGAQRMIVLPSLDRGAIVLELMCWPAILALVERRRAVAATLLYLATLFALHQLISLASVLGLVAAAAAFALAWWWPRLVALPLAGGFALMTLFLPLWQPSRGLVLWLHEAAPWLRTSAQHRLIIWRFTRDRVAEHPLLGWGMDAARAMPGGDTSVKAYLDLPADFPLDGSVMPLHPHDAILQWWVELGLVGAILGAAIFLYVVWRAGLRGGASRGARAGALALIVASLAPLLLSFGIWQAWWQSLLWLAAAFMLATARPARPAQPATGGPLA